MTSADKPSKSGFFHKLFGFNMSLTPNISCTQIHVQSQPTTPAYNPKCIINPIASADSLAIMTRDTLTAQAHMPINVMGYQSQEMQLKKMRKILHVLLDEKRVEEKIRQILHEFVDGIAKQVLLRNATSLSVDVMESEIRMLESRLEIKKKQLSDSLEKEDSLQIEVTEVKSKQSASSRPQINGLPSPTMLQETLDDVFKALKKCASKLYSELAKLHSSGPQSLSITSILFFQQQLCTLFFLGFETLSFNGTQDVNQRSGTFEKPRDMKLRLFQEFSHSKTLDVSSLLQSKQVPFKAFIDSKCRQFILDMDPTPFVDASQRNSSLTSMLDSERCPVYLEFRELGKAIWLLHKLAFALEPTAEIFRVQSNSNYDPEYMKAEQGLESKIAKVYFMAMPGFTVRNLVFKAHVYLC